MSIDHSSTDPLTYSHQPSSISHNEPAVIQPAPPATAISRLSTYLLPNLSRTPPIHPSIHHSTRPSTYRTTSSKRTTNHSRSLTNLLPHPPVHSSAHAHPRKHSTRTRNPAPSEITTDQSTHQFQSSRACSRLCSSTFVDQPRGLPAPTFTSTFAFVSTFVSRCSFKRISAHTSSLQANSRFKPLSQPRPTLLVQATSRSIRHQTRVTGSPHSRVLYADRSNSLPAPTHSYQHSYTASQPAN